MKARILALALLVTSSASADLLYVTNERAGTLQVIDTDKDRVVGRLFVGARPRGPALSPAIVFTSRPATGAADATGTIGRKEFSPSSTRVA